MPKTHFQLRHFCVTLIPVIQNIINTRHAKLAYWHKAQDEGVKSRRGPIQEESKLQKGARGFRC
ncbi:MAG: hypothetical protein ABJI23_13220, partial [Marinobacter sp.]|uniref:hypothetical protein n=1 Tax=Marinobacter sp. TaxID=50741 RepID=UPI0032992594